MPTLRKRKLKTNNSVVHSKRTKLTKVIKTEKENQEKIPDSIDSDDSESSGEFNGSRDPDWNASDVDSNEKITAKTRRGGKKTFDENKKSIEDVKHCQIVNNDQNKNDSFRCWNNLSESDSGSDNDSRGKANIKVETISPINLDNQAKDKNHLKRKSLVVKTVPEVLTDSDSDFDDSSAYKKKTRGKRKSNPKLQKKGKSGVSKRPDIGKTLKEKLNDIKSEKINSPSRSFTRIDVPAKGVDSEFANTTQSLLTKTPTKSDVQNFITSQSSSKTRPKNLKDDQVDSSDDNDWEEVNDSKDIDEYNPIIPKDGVDIMVALPAELQKKCRTKKSYEELFLDYCRMLRRRIVKQNHLNLHKVHLLCLIGRSFYVTNNTFSSLLKGLVMSVAPVNILKLSPQKFTLQNIDSVLLWLHSQFQIVALNLTGTLEGMFLSGFSTFEVTTHTFVYIFAALVSCIGLECRIAFSYQPVAIKDYKKAKNPFLKKNVKSNESRSPSIMEKINDAESSNSVNVEVTPRLTKAKAKAKNQTTSYQSSADRNTSSKKVKKSKKAKESESCSPGENNNSASTMKGSRKSSRKSSQLKDLDSSSFEDSDFEISSSFKSKKSKNKTQSKHEKQPKQEFTIDEWVEIYIPKEKRWVCVDSVNNLVDQENVIENNCSDKMSYVVAFDQNQKCKDVTMRYASGWLNTTPKLRLDWYCGPEWWEKTLKPHLMVGKKAKEENKQLEKNSMDKPLPKSISEYKHHKLFALARHLLKFEAIYPADAPPLGFIRGETVYARECVHTLYSRDHWVQRAKTVRMGETPYKIVKARPGFKKTPENENRTLELFGFWQTEPYDPPVAQDGKVPRNAYGNVELFLPEMLPKGTKHLTEMPGLIRIAKKLNIDCSQAMVGWDFRKGRNVPMMDGWVVCEEHVEILTAAWEEEQVNIMKREEEKREKRIFGNWKKLIKGLLIKQKIEIRYGAKNTD